MDESLRVWLASSSARRSDLILGRWSDQVEVISRGIDGDEPPPSAYHDLLDAVRETCAWKIRTAAAQADPSFSVVLVSDTLIESPSDGRLLGQPDSEESARMMLTDLMGRPHRIATCTAWTTVGDGESALHEHAEVAMIRLLDPGDVWLDAYLASGGWRGKAGGYDAGAEFSSWFTLIEGSILVVLGFSAAGLETLEAMLGIKTNLTDCS